MNARTMSRSLHGRTAQGVPRWAVLAAYATTLTALPSCVWRIAAMIFDVPLLEHRPDLQGSPALSAGWWYIIALSVVSEALAFLAVGLVAEWGQVWPRWIPGLGGRRVPTLAAVIPAGLGATLLMVFPYAMVMFAFGLTLTGEPGGVITHGWQTVVFWAAYLPLAAWGPLLGVLTVHYYRRRRRAAAPGPAGLARAA
ncbi:hypothetical protein ACFVVX_05735 [Kitasatospora sp. NPDC058170]|uniref:hypothetical protein n=1 Tax=Kitasatospora sp. NPDC058170 TaxID=3346364 RepID=UPI0036DE2872